MKRASACIWLWFALAIGPAWADDCLPAGDEGAIAEGRLLKRDGALILKLPQAMCLTGSEDSDNVPASAEIHVYSLEDATQATLEALVGKDVHVRGAMMGALTQHHKAPIVMQVFEADEI